MVYIQHKKINQYELFSGGKLTLLHIDIELTERCNNNCIHCYINQPQNDPVTKSREMSTDFVKSVLLQAAELGSLSVRFTGGEPLLREDFQELYIFARHLGMRVILFTNATMITQELCQLFSRIPPGKPISITVYGMHASSYDAIVARKGAFDEFWHGINLLQKYNIPFEVKQSLLPQNQSEIPEFEAFVATLPNMHYEPGYSMNFDLRARRDNSAKNSIIKGLRVSPQETLAMLTRDPEKYVKEMRKFASKFMGHPDDRLFSCGAGLETCVDAYGIAQMCMLLRHPDTVYPLNPESHQKRHPDIELKPLKYALTKFFPRVRQQRSRNPDYLNRCARCFLMGLCDQCPAKSWEEHGTLDTPVEYLCEIAHAKARFLGLINEGEKAWELEEEIWKARLNNFISDSKS